MSMLTQGFFIIFVLLCAYWMGEVLACLDSIAKSLKKDK